VDTTLDAPHVTIADEVTLFVQSSATDSATLTALQSVAVQMLCPGTTGCIKVDSRRRQLQTTGNVQLSFVRSMSGAVAAAFPPTNAPVFDSYVSNEPSLASVDVTFGGTSIQALTAEVDVITSQSTLAASWDPADTASRAANLMDTASGALATTLPQAPGHVAVTPITHPPPSMRSPPSPATALPTASISPPPSPATGISTTGVATAEQKTESDKASSSLVVVAVVVPLLVLAIVGVAVLGYRRATAKKSYTSSADPRQATAQFQAGAVFERDGAQIYDVEVDVVADDPEGRGTSQSSVAVSLGPKRSVSRM